MISTSLKWKNYSRDIGTFHIKATINNGTSKSLTDEDFMQGSVSITDSVSGMGSFNVGSVITNTFSATLNNFGGKFTNYQLAGARISVKFGIVYEDSTEEWIDRGTYTIEKPTSLGSTIKITGYDDMDKLNKYYIGKHYAGSNIFNPNTITNGQALNPVTGNPESVPAVFYTDYIAVSESTDYELNFSMPGGRNFVFFYDSSKQLLTGFQTQYTFNTFRTPSGASYVRINGGSVGSPYSLFVRKAYGSNLVDIPTPTSSRLLAKYLCDYCGVTYSDTDIWRLANFGVSPNFEGINESTTCRQMLSWLLQVSGGFARISNVGELECKPFNKHEWTSDTSLDGGTINPWSAISTYEGGTISPWSSVTSYNGGNIGGAEFTLSKIKSLDVYVEDITITGVRAYAYNTVDEFQFDTVGTDGYIIALQDNPMIRANTATVASRVFDKVGGLSFRPFNANIIGDPSFEAGDIVSLMDYTGTTHTSLITSLTYSLNQGESLECNAETPEESGIATANPTTSIIAGATTAAYDYITAKKISADVITGTINDSSNTWEIDFTNGTMDIGEISADKITAGTITGAVEATNFTMKGGSIEITAASGDGNIIELNRTLSGRTYQLMMMPEWLEMVLDATQTGIRLFNNGTHSLPDFTVQCWSSSGRSELSATGTGFFTGSVTAASFINGSSVKIKRSIKKYEDSALSKIKAADILTYNYQNEEKDAKEHIGLAIGGEYNVPKELIVDSGEGDAQGIDLYSMISMAWKAIQEQQNEIETLKTEVTFLKEKINGNTDQTRN